MKALVTGAGGFLGQAVVSALLARGTEVRALLRSGTDLQALPWRGRVEVHRGDLRDRSSLAGCLDGVDAVVHLAGSPSANAHELFASAVVGSEHLLDLMAAAEIRRLVLAGSFSVYHPEAADELVDEHSPLETDPYAREGYTVAKLWQERVIRRDARERGLLLTVLRPGLIWGSGHDDLPSLGQRVGRVYLVLGPRTRLRITHVENCADAFATATLDERAIGETFNVVDPEHVSNWAYMRRYRRSSGASWIPVPVPYRLARAAVGAVYRGAAVVLRAPPRLPSLFMPRRFEARFRPLRYVDDKLSRTVGWTPPLTFEEAARRTFTPAEGRP